MASNMAPKFGKVELLLKAQGLDPLSSTVISFEDCGLMMTGDYIIVILDETDEINKKTTSTGKIFSIKDVTSYKTHSL